MGDDWWNYCGHTYSESLIKNEYCGHTYRESLIKNEKWGALYSVAIEINKE